MNSNFVKAFKVFLIIAVITFIATFFIGNFQSIPNFFYNRFIALSGENIEDEPFQPDRGARDIIYAPFQKILFERSFSTRIDTNLALYYVADSVVGDVDRYIDYYEKLFHRLSSWGFPLPEQTLYMVPADWGNLNHSRSNDFENVYYFIHPITEPTILQNVLFKLYGDYLPLWLNGGLSRYLFSLANGQYTGHWYVDESDILTWLEAGMEEDFPDFGDAWFTSYLVGTGANMMRANDIAFTIAAYLVENDYFPLLFANNETSTGSILYDLLQDSFPTAILEGIYLPVYKALSPTLLLAPTSQANYKIYTHQWRHHDIHLILDQLDQSVAFAREMIAPENETILTVRFLRNGEQLLSTDFAGEAYRDGTISMFINSNSPGAISRLLAHEATHAFVFLGLKTPDGHVIPQVLDEGIATFIEYSFVAKLREELDFFKKTLTRYHNFQKNDTDEAEMRFWERYQQLNPDYSEDTVDHRILLNVYAYFESIDSSFDYGRFNLPNQRHIYLTPNNHHDLSNSYRQSGSFVQYLYHRFGMEIILGMIHDFEQVSYLTGYTFVELAGDWRVYLEIE